MFYATQFIAAWPELNEKVSAFMKLWDDTELRAIVIAWELTTKVNVRTMVGFAHPNFPGNPYYCLVFSRGQSYLAEDCDFDYNGDDDSKVTIKVLEPYQWPIGRFDTMGRISAVT